MFINIKQNDIKKELVRYKLIAIILLSFILISPITLYLLMGNLYYAFLIWLFNLVISFIILIKKRKVFLINLYFVITILIFTFLNTELLFRINFKDYNIKNIYEKKEDYYCNKPNLNEVINDLEYQSIYRTNYQGYRIGLEYVDYSNIDWLFIGDSYTQGAQVNYAEMFTSKLQSEERVILNAGISGFGLPEEFAYIKAVGQKLRPKKVILQLCVLNDFEDVFPREYSFESYLKERSQLFRYLWFKNNGTRDKLPLGRWVLPFFKNESENINLNVLYKQSSQLKENSLNNVEYYLYSIKEEVEKFNAELVVILIPTKEQVYPHFYEEVITSYNINDSLVDLELASNLIQSLSNEIGFLFIDPLESFRQDTTMLYFKVDEHLNREGHLKLSNIIRDELISKQ